MGDSFQTFGPTTSNALGMCVTPASPKLEASPHAIGGKSQVHVGETDVDRLLEAAYRALPMLPEELRERVAALLTTESMAIIAGVAAIWAGSHFFGVGAIIDVVFAGVTVLTVGWDAIKALRGYVRYYDTAIHARTDEDYNIAARHFADATLTAASAIGWAKLAGWLGKGASKAGNLVRTQSAAAQLARWKRFINALEFDVPAGQGMLWSKLGNFRTAEELARRKGLTSLEMILKKNGFYELYSREFGKAQTEVTKEIWTMVSRRYVQSLKGEVIGYVNRAAHYQHINSAANPRLINSTDPVIVHEIDEISKILLSNPKITQVTLIDTKTGEAFGFRSRELLESLLKLEQRNP